MFKKIMQIIKKYPLFYLGEETNLEHRLSKIFLFTGLILTLSAFIMGLIFAIPIWYNVPNIVLAIFLFFLPIIAQDKLFDVTKLVLYIVGFLYFPFIYFTNGGNTGAGPFYFLLIITYFTFYLYGKDLVITISSLIIFYILLMIYGYSNPDLIIPYTDDLTRLIDILVALTSLTIVMAFIGHTTYLGYKTEKDHAVKLMKELEKQNSELAEISIKDQLTNTFNRRYFVDSLEKELTNYGSSGFYVMMLDLDHFKSINDTYGHMFGDDVLKKVAATISNCVRDHDVIARYGGEEFIALITHTNVEPGIKIAERIRKQVEEMKFRNNVKVTVSIGISRNLESDTSLRIIKRADDNLYIAKDKGRNRVESAN